MMDIITGVNSRDVGEDCTVAGIQDTVTKASGHPWAGNNLARRKQVPKFSDHSIHESKSQLGHDLVV